MTTTATLAPQFYTCTCTQKPEPHIMPVQRIVVTAADQVDPERVRDALTIVWYDATLFFGPEVVMVVAYEGEATGAAEIAREWATAQGFAAEPYDGESVALVRISPEGVAQPVSDDQPVYRYAA